MLNLTFYGNFKDFIAKQWMILITFFSIIFIAFFLTSIVMQPIWINLLLLFHEIDINQDEIFTIWVKILFIVLLWASVFIGLFFIKIRQIVIEVQYITSQTQIGSQLLRFKHGVLDLAKILALTIFLILSVKIFTAMSYIHIVRNTSEAIVAGVFSAISIIFIVNWSFVSLIRWYISGLDAIILDNVFFSYSGNFRSTIGLTTLTLLIIFVPIFAWILGINKLIIIKSSFFRIKNILEISIPGLYFLMSTIFVYPWFCCRYVVENIRLGNYSFVFYGKHKQLVTILSTYWIIVFMTFLLINYVVFKIILGLVSLVLLLWTVIFVVFIGTILNMWIRYRLAKWIILNTKYQDLTE